MPDVGSSHRADVRLWVSLDVHSSRSSGRRCRVRVASRSLTGSRRWRRRSAGTSIGWGGPDGLAVCYEAGPGGFDLYRLLCSMGVACDVVAPSLILVRAGDRVKTDRRDAKKLVRLYRAGTLSYVHPPTPETEGLRDLLRCRDDLRRARIAARNRVLKQLLRHGRIYREGKHPWAPVWSGGGAASS
jgi:transposase